ncbi:ATPase component of ABC transporters with duplicated ATPase domain [Desulfosporosinus orientis DSM 765]|uniref:ATPase component of ABC transporters with duplicated ATPase domain n=1 Tax=Desulfosporosinus orientis (strain ATCC 19365 / DSM 765 / NCIMB 8382 / VKM B-1628 / Singapore I) TaxID=768706 RepID=G7WJK2_DESOD|nr:ABC-F family ATP-binding cassette domain-containing protein [Desulfosporosinus orientis]AET70439.1 ATPase component of ABC transporters with duplicated ATPase domain [Desulfosporosinus orientis DSM 765]
MNVLTVENITKSYGEKVLFADISFGIDEGEKIGIIGVNGTGKSTLLKILAGNEWPDSGKVTMGNSLRMDYLPQNPDFEDQATVLQQVFKGNSPVMKLLREYELALESLNETPDSSALQQRLIDLGQQMDELDAWQLENEAKTILTKLGISKFETPVGNLSGGQRKRVALASALINPTDILLLDEPTNHIDNETVDWLEQYLNKRKGALVMITHDRYFLDRVVGRVLELDRGKLYPYPGNYSRFLELKAEREEQEDASERKRQNLLRNELAWMRRGAQARSTKQKARIERFEKLQAEKPLQRSDQIEMPIGATRLGKKILECRNLRKEFPQRGVVIKDFSYILLRNDRIGIIGPNGSGKSTLLNLIAGSLTPDFGTIELGSTVKMGYFSQETTYFDPDIRVIDDIKGIAEVIPMADGGFLTASQMLERFLFLPEVQWTQIGKLSGGEKRRLNLLRILMGAPNVLLLDEPTNDLDIQTLTILENYLDDFPGAVIAVSHDRYFLDRVTDKIFAFEGNGRIRSYAGNYSDYREQVYASEQEAEQAAKLAALAKTIQNKDAKPDQEESERKKDRPLKMTFKEQQEFAQIEGQIEEMEQAIEKNTQDMNEAGSDYGKLTELAALQQTLEQRLEELMERWTYLTELDEKITASKR